MNAKKKLPPFLAGALTAALVIGLAGTALAAVSGTVRFDGVAVSVWSEQQGETLAAGDTFTTENGTQAPAVITYVDEQGGGTTYLSLRRLAELLDAPIGWDEETQTVLFAQYPGPTGETEIVVGVDPDPNEGSDTPLEPVLDMRAGPFTEIAPLTSDKGQRMPILLDADISSRLGYKQEFLFAPVYGPYIEITVTNHGVPVSMQVSRPYYTDTGGMAEEFSTIQIGTGETVTRAFMMDEDTVYPTNRLKVEVEQLYSRWTEAPADITVNVDQFDLKEELWTVPEFED